MIEAKLWAELAAGSGRVARAWWDEYQAVLVDVAESELKEIAKALAAGDTYRAKVIAASGMDQDEWDAYRDGTTDQLQGVALRRVLVRDALDDLGRRTAKIIGGILLGQFQSRL